MFVNQSTYRQATAGRSGDRIPVKARFSTPVQTAPGPQPASCKMGTGSFHGTKSGRGVTLTPHPLLVPWSRKVRTIHLLTLWSVRPVKSPNACKMVHCTFTNITFHINPYSVPKRKDGQNFEGTYVHRGGRST